MKKNFKKKICLAEIANLFFCLLILNYSTSILSAQNINDIKVRPDSTKKIAEKKDSTLIKKGKLAVHPIKSISLLPNELAEFRINKSKIVALDCSFTGDYLLNTPFAFQKKLGYTGLLTETMIYGSGLGSVSFSNDGIELNNRLFESFDLISFQSESIDSIDVIPLSRSFLFGNLAQAAVNFIPREPSLSKPFSRIRYYQAPNDEGFIDGIFSINPFKKTNVYFEITNNSNGLRYKNSDFTSWGGDTRINYFLSNEINFKFGYKHVTSTVQLNGGVDIDSIGSSQALFSVTDIVYDNISAPVRFYNRYSTSIIDNIYLSAKMLLWKNAPSVFTIYSNHFTSEYRQNVSGTIQNGVPAISRDNISQTSGLKFKQDFSDEMFSLSGTASFERSVFNIDQYASTQANDSLRILNLDGKRQNTFSLSVSSSARLFEKYFIPSIYSKYLIQDGNNFLGVGTDATVFINENIKIYGGFSRFEKPFSAYIKNMIDNNKIENSQTIKTAELRFLYKHDLFNLSFGYFFTANNNKPLFAFNKPSLKNDEATFLTAKSTELKGFNFSFDAKIWKLSFLTNSSYYFSNDNRTENGLPGFTITGGTYYVDTLFNDNLKLKVGINIYGYGSRYQQQIDFERNILSPFIIDSQNPNTLTLFNNTSLSPSFQLDLFISGKIQDAATIYFTWENLFNNKYSIVPNYPMPLRGIRFGFSWEFFD